MIPTFRAELESRTSFYKELAEIIDLTTCHISGVTASALRAIIYFTGGLQEFAPNFLADDQLAKCFRHGNNDSPQSGRVSLFEHHDAVVIYLRNFDKLQGQYVPGCRLNQANEDARSKR